MINHFTAKSATCMFGIWCNVFGALDEARVDYCNQRLDECVRLGTKGICLYCMLI